MRFTEKTGPPRLHALATRRGFWFAMATLAAFTFLAATEFRRSAESILIVQDEIQRHQATGSQSALNQIAHLNGRILSALERNEASATDFSEIQLAIDTLYVRADHISRRLEAGASSVFYVKTGQSEALITEGAATVVAIDALVSLMDQALAAPDPIAALATPELFQAIETARAASFRYLQRTTRLKSALMSLQTEKVLFLSRATLVFLSIVTLAGAVSLHTLRLEVLARA